MTVHPLPAPPSLSEYTLDQLRAMIEEGLEALAEVRRRLEPEQPMQRVRLRLVDN